MISKLFLISILGDSIWKAIKRQETLTVGYLDRLISVLCLFQQKDDNQCPSDDRISHTEPEPANNQPSPKLDMLVDGGASLFEGNEKQVSS